MRISSAEGDNEIELFFSTQLCSLRLGNVEIRRMELLLHSVYK